MQKSGAKMEEGDGQTRMRHIYAGLAFDEVALAGDLAHAYDGTGASCSACGRGPSHPFHDLPAEAGDARSPRSRRPRKARPRSTR